MFSGAQPKRASLLPVAWTARRPCACRILAGGMHRCAMAQERIARQSSSAALVSAGHISIWDTRKAAPALRVHAHSADVNVMSWNRLASCMLVSGCDDGTFRIWYLCLFAHSLSQAHELAMAALALGGGLLRHASA